MLGHASSVAPDGRRVATRSLLVHVMNVKCYVLMAVYMERNGCASQRCDRAGGRGDLGGGG